MERSSAVASDARPELDRGDLLADAGGNCDARRLHCRGVLRWLLDLAGSVAGRIGCPARRARLVDQRL